MSDSPTDRSAATEDPTAHASKSHRLSRRKILGGLAVGGAALSLPAVAAAQAGGRRDDDDGSGRGRGGRRDGRGGNGRGDEVDPNAAARFSRMFGEGDAFDDVDDELRAMLAELGAPGGILDANDPIEAGPARLFNEPELSVNNPNNTLQTAGSTFFGQFIDHDITLDSGSTLGRRTAVTRSMNLRSAQLDLDSVYGGGPDESPDLYRDDDRFLLRVESGGLFEDLPRDSEGVAIIGDPRNDENLMLSGLHAAFLLFHNQVLAQVRSTGVTGQDAFDQARRIVVHHYQWLVLDHFLPEYVGQAMVDEILANGRQFYTPTTPTIPVEFQTSAFRFGHSLVRPSYRANLAGDDGEPFFGMVFVPTQFGQDDPGDLSGGHRAPRRFIDWQTFFDFGDGEVHPNKRVDTRMSTPLFQLPLGTISNSRGEPIGPTSLATRNLLRHITWSIPSGQQVADQMGVTRLGDADLADIDAIVPRLAGATPLWLYLLREADVEADGAHLGTVGGRIVGEVLIGLLELDPTSILNTPGWQPTLDSAGGPGTFTITDLLTIAGVDPTSRGQ